MSKLSKSYRTRMNVVDTRVSDNIPEVQFEHLIDLYNESNGWLQYVNEDNLVLDKQCKSLDEFILLYDDVENNLIDFECMYEGDDL